MLIFSNNGYGNLSGKPVSAGAGDLIFKSKVVKGLWLSEFANKWTNILKVLRFKNELPKLLDSTLNTDVQATFRLENVVDAIITYTQNPSGGKVHLICGDAEPGLM